MKPKSGGFNRIRMTKLAFTFLVIWSIGGCMDSDRYVEVRLEPWELSEYGEPYQSEQGYVPDAETAVAIAEAVLKSAYGDDALDHQRPLRVMLADSVWVVLGSMPEEALGGVARVDIAKRDGAMIHVGQGE